MTLLRVFLSISFLMVSVFDHAQEVFVPDELEQWQKWVLHDYEYLACPVQGVNYRCIWPGRLSLDTDADGARFRQMIDVLDDQYVKLPGSSSTWPVNVTVNGNPVAVVARDKQPFVFLESGKNIMEGEFRWSRAPDTLALGNGTGLLSLTVNGLAIERPRWNSQEIWISQGAQAQSEETQNRIGSSVYRLIEDGAPVVMHVHLKLDVSGDSREETIGQLLPQGFKPAYLEAPLPARLDDKGNLKIQARPGSWEFKFVAIAPAPLEQLTFTPVGSHWPEEEVWSYKSAPSIRATEVRAQNAVDPQQAGVPLDWAEYPAFQMNSADSMEVVERRRGRAVGENNRLILERQLWFDFDRKGYTARDVIRGNMVTDWRLDLMRPFQLESAQARTWNEDKTNLLVTHTFNDSPSRGVELRSPTIELTALSRLVNSASTIPVTGWNSRFDSVRTQLYLPPGHRLLAASNVDSAPGAWIARWDLLDFFVVLIVTVAVWRLIAPWAGIVALLALSLSFHEDSAPHLAWLNLIAAFALLKYLPAGKFRLWIRNYSWISLVLVTLVVLPFSVEALRVAVYPQLELSGAGSAMSGTSLRVERPAASVGIEVTNTVNMESQAGELEEVVVTGSRSKRNILNRYSPNARVQTGPGVPSWTWISNSLYWNSPVDVGQTTRLWVATPWMMRVWRVLMVLLLGTLLAAFARRALNTRGQMSSGSGANALVVLFASGLALSSVLPAQSVHAETPSSAVLEELRERLTKAPECVPDCVDISRARAVLSNDRLEMELIAHAQTYTVLPLPGRLGSWVPESIIVNGNLSDSVRVRSSNVMEVRLNEGVHRIKIAGRLPVANTVGIAFPVAPHHFEVVGSGWEVTGVSDGRLTGSALTLIRQRSEGDQAILDAVDVEQFPAFVTVHRELNFDLDWSVRTTVRRQTPPTAAINLTIPLLPGESVTEDRLGSTSESVQVSIPAGAESVSWSSTLARRPEIVLQAPQGEPWQEHWQLRAGESWRLEFSGVPQLNNDRSQESVWVARFTPWPGEELTLNLSRPEAVEGETLAIDQALLTQTIGRRSSNASLSFSYRATRGSQHSIELPQNSELSQVLIDGEIRNLALEEGTLRVPIVPGSHNVVVSWRSLQKAAFHNATDLVDFNMPLSNLTVRMVNETNRWTLWTRGPQLGPAVLYWSELLVLVIVAILLARYGRTPLKMHHWVLLGLGFSTFFWPAFAIVAAAILALSWRGQHVLEERVPFNLVQFALTGLVIAAALSLLAAIPYGLLGKVNMHVTGNSSHASFLNWFVDQSPGLVATGHVYSLPMWIYKVAILLWALWLAFALLSWLPWMWRSYSKGGFWRRRSNIVKPSNPLVSDD